MKRFIFGIIILLSLPLINLQSQVEDLKVTFLEAESYFLFEEYNEALPLYLKIHRAEPENDNVNYKIGVCFLNDPYQKEKSIKYLEDATKNINPKYKENNFKEKTAPLEAYFYLGKAYLVNNEIDKALENYKYFRSILDEKIYDVELIDEQIKICNNARKLITMPVDYDLQTLPPFLNTRFPDKNPIISADGKRLVYVSEQRFYDATFFAEKKNGVWQPPRNIIPELGVDGDVYPTCLSTDGTLMIIYRNDDFIGNLYQSEYVNGSWTKLKKLGDKINTKFWESHGSLSLDGKTLYFTSNRTGGYGGLDIYKSEKQADGSWGEPKNLGGTINTRYNEETPFITENGQYLYFSSYGHYNMGGYDIFYSKKKADGGWDTPVNLGYPINTTDDDLFFQPVDNGNSAYLSLYKEDGQGLNDIYFMNVYSDNNPRMYMVTGYLETDNGTLTDKDGVRLYLIDRMSGDTIFISYPNLKLRNFTLNAPQGIYDLVVKSNTFDDLVRKLEINSKTDKEGIKLDEILALKTKPYVPAVITGAENKIQLEDSIFHVKSGLPLKIKMRIEPNAKLFADVFVDETKTASDSFFIDKRRFTYEMVPDPGLNIVKLKLRDELGDISLRTVLVYTDGAEEQAVIETPAELPLISDILPVSKQDSINQALQRIADHLKIYAEGNLKETLADMRISDMELGSTRDLLEYLVQKGAENNYDINDLDKAAATSVSGGDMELLTEVMKDNATGNLKEFIGKMDLVASGILTPEQFMKYLRENDKDQPYFRDDIMKMMAGALDQISTEADLFLLQMIQKADSPLKEILKALNLKALKIFTVDDLIEYLRKNAEALGININDLELLIGLLTGNYKDIPEPEPDKREGKFPIILAVGGGLTVIAFFIVWLFLFLRRKKKKET